MAAACTKYKDQKQRPIPLAFLRETLMPADSEHWSFGLLVNVGSPLIPTHAAGHLIFLVLSDSHTANARTATMLCICDPRLVPSLLRVALDDVPAPGLWPSFGKTALVVAFGASRRF